MMNNSKDILAKLLSTEDVQVVRAEVPTASFDVVGRTLTLPTFVNLDENIENLMIGHEVGHALFTPHDSLQEDAFKDKLVKNYANVIEDVRIEKLIQKEYPGLTTDFVAGYKTLAKSDFFRVGDRDINSLQLIDKINLYFKIGLKSGIKFSAEEFEIVSRVDGCKSFKQVFALAKELAQYARDKKQGEEEAKEAANKSVLDDLAEEDAQEKREEAESQEQQGDGDTTPWDDDEEDKEEEGDDETDADSKDQTSPGNTQEENTANEFNDPYDYPHDFDESLESKTQEALDNNMRDQSKFDGKIFRTLDHDEMPFGVDPVITYQEILQSLTTVGGEREGYSVKDRLMNDDGFTTDRGNYCSLFYSRTGEVELDNFKECYGREYLGNKSGLYYQDDYKNFLDAIKDDINFMVKEFEMKKSASRYARTQTAKSGQLNINKLYNYKLSEDLFKRINLVADDKNHGFIMLVDWSGSMHDVMRDTVRQVIVLSTFCRKVNIPFEVLAFSNHDNTYNSDYVSEHKNHPDIAKMTAKRHANSEKLHYMERDSMFYYQLLTHDMSGKDFDEMCFLLHSFIWQYSNALSLSGTPLTEALEVAVGYTGRFIKKHNIDKMNFITLTDGAGWSKGFRDNSTKFNELYPDAGWNYKKQDTLIDPMTKKKYKIVGKSSSSAYDMVFLDMIKTRYNASTIGYFIGRNTQQGMQQFRHYNVVDEHDFDVADARVAVRKNGGWASFKGCGRDEMFFLDSKKLNPVSDEIKIDGKGTASQIARSFSKGLKQNRQSKVLMSTFVERVA